jgi:hypothetical protein
MIYQTKANPTNTMKLRILMRIDRNSVNGIPSTSDTTTDVATRKEKAIASKSAITK